MPRKTKENLRRSNKNSKQNKTQNIKPSTKEEKFSFDEEIVIGLKRIDEPKSSDKLKKKEKRKIKNNKGTKEKSKALDKRKNENKIEEDNLVIKSKYLENYEQKANQGKTLKNKTRKNKNNKNNSKPLTKKQQIAIRKKKIVLKCAKWTTLIGIIAGTIIGTMLSPMFNITNIYVEGNSKIASETIISLSKLNINENIFKFRTSDTIKSIKENAYIDKVEIKRKLPNEVGIKVYEREATFMISVGNGYAYINNQGYILEITGVKTSIPILEGLKTKNEEIKAGNRLVQKDLENLEDVLKIMEAAKSIDTDIDELITKINMSNNSNYILTLEKEKKEVYLGDTSNLSTKMLWISEFLEVEKKYEGTIYLNINLNNERPYFREKV